MLSFIAIVVSCGSNKKNVAQDSIVEVCKPQLSDSESVEEFPFISKPFRTSELSFRVGGTISKFDLLSGKFYKKGDIISQIDSRDFLIRKNCAEALLKQVKSEYERIEKLFAKDNISAAIYEKTKADYASALAAYETALNQFNDTKLIAPFDGYVGEIYIDKFQDVKASQPIISFIETGSLKIEVYVTQNIAINLKKGDKCEIMFDAVSNKSFYAAVEEISKNTTKNNLSYRLTAILDNSNYTLLSGMSGKLYFKSTNTETAQFVVIPQYALCHRPTEGDFVWVVEPGSCVVSQRKVEVETIVKNGVKISNGLTTEDIVASSGLRFLSEGMRVKIKE